LHCAIFIIYNIWKIKYLIHFVALGGDDKSIVGIALRNQLNGESLGDVLEQLRRCPVGLETDISKTISFGVAFHHAGYCFYFSKIFLKFYLFENYLLLLKKIYKYTLIQYFTNHIH